MITKNFAELPPLRSDFEKHMRETKEFIKEQNSMAAEEMSDFFTVRQKGYDEHMMMFAPCYDVTASHIPADCRRLLDLGCGTGLELDALDRICVKENRPFPSVVGVDMTQALVDQLYAKHPNKDITVLMGSYFDVPLGNEEFDCAVSVESMHHFALSEKLPLFRRIRDALTPDGVFLLCDFYACCKEEEELYEEHWRTRRALNKEVGEKDFVHVDRPKLPNEEAALLLEAGFAEVTYATVGVEGTLLLIARK